MIDGNYFNKYIHKDTHLDLKEPLKHVCIEDGDNIYACIAAASILAKEYHDEYIKNLVKNDQSLEVYDWENNMCYGTKKHIDGIKQYGISKYHRKTYGICKNY